MNRQALLTAFGALLAAVSLHMPAPAQAACGRYHCGQDHSTS